MEKDLLVIGGGINGVGIAADAAGRGLSVVLCEMGDVASGTSSASSKLIHGGLRYLENGDFGLVRDSLRERKILLRLAPHLIKKQAFVMPHCPWLRPYWIIRAGLFIYDYLFYDGSMPRSRSLNKTELMQLELKEQYTKALQYYDCTEDDSRLVVSVALLARQHGADIMTIDTRCGCIGQNIERASTLHAYQDKVHMPTIQNLLSRIGEIDGDPIADPRLHLSQPPVRRAGMAHDHARLKKIVHSKAPLPCNMPQ